MYGDTVISAAIMLCNPLSRPYIIYDTGNRPDFYVSLLSDFEPLFNLSTTDSVSFTVVEQCVGTIGITETTLDAESANLA